jgi:hypothetical protein
MASVDINEILKLSVSDRMELVEAIWAGVSAPMYNWCEEWTHGYATDSGV